MWEPSTGIPNIGDVRIETGTNNPFINKDATKVAEQIIESSKKTNKD